MVLSLPSVSHSNSSLLFMIVFYLTSAFLSLPWPSSTKLACFQAIQLFHLWELRLRYSGWSFGCVSRVIVPDRNKGCKVLACAFNRSECWGHDCIPLVFLYSWKPLTTPKYLPKRIEAVFKLLPSCISGCLRLLKLRKLAKSQRKSYTVPSLTFLLLRATGKTRLTGSTLQETSSAGIEGQYV